MNVFITGTSKGIGRELVEIFKKDPAIDTIYICSRNPKEEKTDQIIPIQLDFEETDWEKKLQAGVKNNPIHILINNAGYLKSEQFKDASMDEVHRMFTINYFGPYKLMQLLHSNLKQNGAHIINIGSMGGYQGSSKFPGLSAYSSSKAALANLTECLAEELKEDNIKVNCLALGAVNTEMLAQAFPEYQAPVGPKSMANYIVSFAKTGHEVMNGKIIPVSVTTP